MLYPVLVGTQGLRYEVRGTEMPNTLEIKKRYAKVIMSKTKPTQEIGMVALMRVTNLPRHAVYSGLQWLRVQGLASMTQRFGNVEGSLVKFYPEPLPEGDRDRLKKAPTVRVARKANGLFHMTRTFNVEGGIYTAEQLEPLAKAVLKELGQ